MIPTTSSGAFSRRDLKRERALGVRLTAYFLGISFLLGLSDLSTFFLVEDEGCENGEGRFAGPSRLMLALPLEKAAICMSAKAKAFTVQAMMATSATECLMSIDILDLVGG
mmetsp:Transcript_61883/g.182769  ORF Transcript_61883/g.182769 Transcript_61883/m.182769 type:complete len:111 (-) Transcript_61883:161-493(-)